jgi:hypothetical protein
MDSIDFHLKNKSNLNIIKDNNQQKPDFFHFIKNH